MLYSMIWCHENICFRAILTAHIYHFLIASFRYSKCFSNSSLIDSVFLCIYWIIKVNVECSENLYNVNEIVVDQHCFYLYGEHVQFLELFQHFQKRNNHFQRNSMDWQHLIAIDDERVHITILRTTFLNVGSRKSLKLDNAVILCSAFICMCILIIIFLSKSALGRICFFFVVCFFFWFKFNCNWIFICVTLNRLMAPVEILWNVHVGRLILQRISNLNFKLLNIIHVLWM